MREIKYRAWDNERNEMFTPMILDWIPGEIPIKNPIRLWHQRSQVSDDGFWVDNFELLLFTGLKDKNGKEIYEGNICSEIIPKRLVVIEFFEGGFVRVDTKYNYSGKIYPEQLEIIGNIYKNPELLNDSNQTQGVKDERKEN